MKRPGQLRVPLPWLPAWLRWAGVIAVAGFIFYTSIVRTPATAVDTVKPTVLPLDKWRHLVAYATLGVTLAYGVDDTDVSRRVQVATVLLVATSYGLGIEGGQALLPDRYFSLADAYSNALGAVLSSTWYLVRPYLEPVPLSELLPRTDGVR